MLRIARKHVQRVYQCRRVFRPFSSGRGLGGPSGRKGVGRAFGIAGGVAAAIGLGFVLGKKREIQPARLEDVSDDVADAVGEHKEWKQVLRKCIPAIVTIRMSFTRNFDTETPGTSQATGFVVDKSRGIILTNRHVLGSGPVVATATFPNNETVELIPLYRDPVHDFGFFQFDPKKVRHIKVGEIPLKPENAHVGLDIRVVGNDAGEKLSILQGTLARLDRRAPTYGSNQYNDFNTFYYQAASSTSGGSSGSPVLDRTGAAVALNAAGKSMSASSFYLPLDRVKRALHLIQKREVVTRGTLQTEFQYIPFDELRRLGLPINIEQEIRQMHKTTGGMKEHGMLVASSILPGGPGSRGDLCPGDILYKVDGDICTRFVPLEDKLDSKVFSSCQITVLRGRKVIDLNISVGDLHEITPKILLEAGGGVFNDLSYHQARNHNIPAVNAGVYVSKPGYMMSQAGLMPGTIIRAVNGQSTPNLAKFERILSEIPDGEKMRLRVSHVSSPRQEAIVVPCMDRKWFPMLRRVRNDETGRWEATKIPIIGSPTISKVSPVTPGTAIFDPGKNAAERAVSKSLVRVTFAMPYLKDGLESRYFTGTGLVCDVKNGLVVVDRNTVPTGIGDVKLNFAGSVEIPGRVVFVHPLHNVSVVKYDPKLVAGIGVQVAHFHEEEEAYDGSKRFTKNKIAGLTRNAAEENEKKNSVREGKFSGDSARNSPEKRSGSNKKLDKEKDGDEDSNSSDKVWVVGLSHYSRVGQRLVSRRGVSDTQGQVHFQLPNPPRYQEQNIELIVVNGVSSTQNQDGVIVHDKSNKILGYWASFFVQVQRGHTQVFYGIPASTIKDAVKRAQANLIGNEQGSKCKALGVELEKVSVATARDLGVHPEWLQKAIKYAQDRNKWPPSIFAVRRRWGGTHAAEVLKDGDIVMAIDNKPIHTFMDADEAVTNGDEKHGIGCTIHRDGKEKIVSVNPVEMSNSIIGEEVVLFAGASLQKPPFAATHQYGIRDEGVYVANFIKGSPAERYRLPPTSRIVEVDGKPTKDLNAFLECVSDKKNGMSILMKVVTLQGRTRMLSLVMDTVYWPTERISANKGSANQGPVD